MESVACWNRCHLGRAGRNDQGSSFRENDLQRIAFKFEAGTPDFIGVVGLGEALEYVKVSVCKRLPNMNMV